VLKKGLILQLLKKEIKYLKKMQKEKISCLEEKLSVQDTIIFEIKKENSKNTEELEQTKILCEILKKENTLYKTKNVDYKTSNKELRILLAKNEGKIIGMKEAVTGKVINNNSYINNPKIAKAKLKIDNIQPLTVNLVKENLHKYEYDDL
jgi:hypothetical protein